MARLGVTYKDIANAADQLVEQGRQPTIEQIRHLLGTGSTTTIANHLRKWRAERDGSISIAVKENLPPELVSTLKDLWQRVLDHANEQIDNAKQENEQAIAVLQQENDKYKTNNQRWQKLHDQWMQLKLALEQSISALQKDNTAWAAKWEAQQLQLHEKQQRIEELNRLHKLAQENLEHFRDSARVQRLREQEKYMQQLQQVENKLKSTLQDNQAMQDQLRKTEIDCAAMRYESMSVLDKLTKLESENATWQHKYAKNNSKITDIEKQMVILQEQLSTEKSVKKMLQEQNALLMQEKCLIAEEKAQLFGQIIQMQINLESIA